MDELVIKYYQDFNEVLDNIKKYRQKAYFQVNHTVIEAYWQTGKFISNKVESANWGKGIVKELAKFIYENDPTIKGYSDKNLWRMKQFYETYCENGKLSPLVRELPWTHNTIIFSRCKTEEEQEFYLKLTIRERYSKRDLERQIDTSLFERVIIGNQKISINNILANHIISSKNNLSLTSIYTENYTNKLKKLKT